MPELPEVEAARALVDLHCKGREIVAVEAAEDAKIFDGATPEQLAAALEGRHVLAAKRKGKHLWLELGGEGPTPLLHFGMTGFISVKEGGADGHVHSVAYENAPQGAGGAWPPRFHKLVLRLGPRQGGGGGGARASSCELAYCDARRFGKVKLVDGAAAGCEGLLAKLGFDPLLEMPALPRFAELLAARAKGAAKLKPLLLDQSFAAGVGNWVADEVLWQARLHPEQLLVNMGPEHVEALHGALRDVVAAAVAADADSSRFPRDWMFHVRWGKGQGQQPKLAGHRVDHITVGSRTSAYVPALQKLVGGGAGKATKAGKKPPSGGRTAAAAGAAGVKRKKRDAADGDGSEGSEQQQEEDDREGGQEAGGGGAPGGQGQEAPAVATPAQQQQQQQPKKRARKAPADKAGATVADGGAVVAAGEAAGEGRRRQRAGAGAGAGAGARKPTGRRKPSAAAASGGAGGDGGAVAGAGAPAAAPSAAEKRPAGRRRT